MTVIGIDSAGKVAGCTVLQEDKVLWHRSLDEGLTHSETLLDLVGQAFEETGLAPGKVDAYGIIAGPGSFTGLRIGLSLVKGMCLVHGTRVAPVSTLHALALGSGLSGSVVAALNARRGEVYWAAFHCENGVCKRITQDAAAHVSTLRQTLLSLPGPIHVVGDGADICYTEYENDIGLVVAPGQGLGTASVGAAKAALAAAGAGGLLPAAGLKPEYLRLSQAERERAEKQHNTKAG